MAREGQGYPCSQRDMMMMMIYIYSIKNIEPFFINITNCTHTHTHTYIYIYILQFNPNKQFCVKNILYNYIYIYIHIDRESEKERTIFMHTHCFGLVSFAHFNIHDTTGIPPIYIYIYIYIYICVYYT